MAYNIFIVNYKNKYIKNMPQLVPFYFLNQLVYGFALVTILLVLFAQYFLPQILRLYVSRLFISKL